MNDDDKRALITTLLAIAQDAFHEGFAIGAVEWSLESTEDAWDTSVTRDIVQEWMDANEND